MISKGDLVVSKKESKNSKEVAINNVYTVEGVYRHMNGEVYKLTLTDGSVLLPGEYEAFDLSKMYQMVLDLKDKGIRGVKGDKGDPGADGETNKEELDKLKKEITQLKRDITNLKKKVD